jgi:hypothetical protein
LQLRLLGFELVEQGVVLLFLVEEEGPKVRGAALLVLPKA